MRARKGCKLGFSGRVPVCGLLSAARRRGMSIARLDLRNSGDTAGPRGRVVGYGRCALFERTGQELADGKLDGDRLSVNVAGSGIQSVMLSADAQIYGVEKRRLGDIG